MDMHIHDLDMIRYLFGEPESVSCCSQDIDSKFDIVYSQLLSGYFSDCNWRLVSDRYKFCR